jgi:hypothetical protein
MVLIWRNGDRRIAAPTGDDHLPDQGIARRQPLVELPHRRRQRFLQGVERVLGVGAGT